MLILLTNENKNHNGIDDDNKIWVDKEKHKRLKSRWPK